MEPAAPQRPVAYGQPGSTESLALDTLDTGNTFDTCLTTIPEQLVRAVDITEALSGFGQHWASIKARPEDYQLSRTVAQISAFVSHDWTMWKKKKKCVTRVKPEEIEEAFVNVIEVLSDSVKGYAGPGSTQKTENDKEEKGAESLQADEECATTEEKRP
eukprot:TRINITY_DN16873_c0_g3_i1.p1 TRINITY_DN16873_c0_g3~~TRINITY_DN16873_c0_g3_i1.p1  ORF type:complete len:159 (+),score=50.67 TRINITY_DN16873_c0_g3_i1:71-547(+)